MTASRRRALIPAAVLTIALATSGCSLILDRIGPPADDAPSYADTRAQALAIRDEMQATIPAEAIIGQTDDEVRIVCDAGSSIAQFEGIRTIAVSPELDRAGWLDDAADRFGSRPGWRYEKKVLADDSSDATSALSLVSEDGYYVHLGEFPDAPNTGPVLVLSASGPCSVEASP